MTKEPEATVVVVTDPKSGAGIDCYIEVDGERVAHLPAIDATREVSANEPGSHVTLTLLYGWGMRWEERDQ